MKVNSKGFVPVLVLVATLGLISFLAISSIASFAATTPPDVTSQVENLGNPFTDRPLFARNVWDMQAFQGKIFFGHGDSVINTNSIVPRYFNTTTNQFGNLGSYNDTQIDRMRVMNGALYFPSLDEQGAATPLGYSTYDGTSWIVHYTIPRTSGSHVGDVYIYNGGLYSLSYSGLYKTNDIVLTNSPQNWQKIGSGDGTFFEINGVLYESDVSKVYRVNADNTTTLFGQEQFGPGTAGQFGYYFRSASVGPTTLLIFDSGFQWHTPPSNDLNNTSYGLYRTTGPGNSSKITFPTNVLPIDLLTRADGVYLLSANLSVPGQVVNTVSKFDSSLMTITEVFHFTAPTFARSFEELNGDWYFGLGDSPTYNYSTGATDSSKLSTATGSILRVKASALNPVPTSLPSSGQATPTPKPKIVGDINNSGKVDILDYNLLITDYGATSGLGLRSDLNGSGKVDILDYNLLITNYGKTAP